MFEESAGDFLDTPASVTSEKPQAISKKDDKEGADGDKGKLGDAKTQASLNQVGNSIASAGNQIVTGVGNAKASVVNKVKTGTKSAVGYFTGN